MVAIKQVKGLNWGGAAISNAEWSGACLDDVLKSSGINIDTYQCEHIIFDGMDSDPTGWFKQYFIHEFHSKLYTNTVETH